MPPMHRWLGWLLDGAVGDAPDQDAVDGTDVNSGPSEDSGVALCTTCEHIGKHVAKTRDALVENPEFLNSGMLVGEDPTLNTGSKTPPP